MTAPPQRPSTSKTSLVEGVDTREVNDEASSSAARATDYSSLSRFQAFTPFTGRSYHDDNNVMLTPNRIARLMTSPITGEEHGSQGVWVGLSTFMIAGCAIGAVLPKNESLPTPWYRILSSCVGYSYFVCWAVSFYPQATTNFRRKTTVGLSADFCSLNVLGFACYTIYNVSLFYNTMNVQSEYRIRHGDNSEITVQSNDVAFAVHALLLSSITLAQIGYYDGFHERISKQVAAILIALILVIGLGLCFVSAKLLEFLDFLYLLSYIKILITLLKYLPQIILNFQRRSTHGFSIWQILLDLSGGVLSILQLVFDCVDLKDFSGLTGNMAKFLLGAVSVVFDTIIILQHYLWFPDTTAMQELRRQRIVAEEHGGVVVTLKPPKTLDTKANQGRMRRYNSV